MKTHNHARPFLFVPGSRLIPLRRVYNHRKQEYVPPTGGSSHLNDRKGFTLPNRILATAAPPLSPGYQASSIAGHFLFPGDTPRTAMYQYQDDRLAGCFQGLYQFTLNAQRIDVRQVISFPAGKRVAYHHSRPVLFPSPVPKGSHWFRLIRQLRHRFSLQP